MQLEADQYWMCRSFILIKGKLCALYVIAYFRVDLQNHLSSKHSKHYSPDVETAMMKYRKLSTLDGFVRAEMQ